jgi:hypothetical protein
MRPTMDSCLVLPIYLYSAAFHGVVCLAAYIGSGLLRIQKHRAISGSRSTTRPKHDQAAWEAWDGIEAFVPETSLAISVRLTATNIAQGAVSVSVLHEE